MNRLRRQAELSPYNHSKTSEIPAGGSSHSWTLGKSARQAAGRDAEPRTPDDEEPDSAGAAGCGEADVNTDGDDEPNTAEGTVAADATEAANGAGAGSKVAGRLREILAEVDDTADGLLPDAPSDDDDEAAGTADGSLPDAPSDDDDEADDTADGPLPEAPSDDDDDADANLFETQAGRMSPHMLSSRPGPLLPGSTPPAQPATDEDSTGLKPQPKILDHHRPHHRHQQHGHPRHRSSATTQGGQHPGWIDAWMASPQQ